MPHPAKWLRSAVKSALETSSALQAEGWDSFEFMPADDVPDLKVRRGWVATQQEVAPGGAGSPLRRFLLVVMLVTPKTGTDAGQVAAEELDDAQPLVEQVVAGLESPPSMAIEFAGADPAVLQGIRVYSTRSITFEVTYVPDWT